MARLPKTQLSLYRSQRYIFELNVGYECDMRCSFCFEQGNKYKQLYTSRDALDYFANYIKYVKNSTSLACTVTIFGGEPFLYIDNIIYFVEKISTFIDGVSIISNGLNIHKYEKEIDYIKSLVNHFQISISYNFSLQNVTRQIGSYQIVRDNIGLLCFKGFEVNCNTVFTPKTIHHIGEVCDDFLDLKRKSNSCKLVWNYYKDDTPFSEIKLDILEDELLRIQQKVFTLIYDYNDSFRYNLIGSFRGDHRVDCLFASVRAALTPDGSIYPGYDLPYSNEFTKNLLRFGKVGDDFKQIDKRREELLKILPVNPPRHCKTCPTQCRVIPWRTMIDDISQYNQLPHPERCKLINFVGKYIPIGYETY